MKKNILLLFFIGSIFTVSAQTSGMMQRRLLPGKIDTLLINYFTYSKFSSIDDVGFSDAVAKQFQSLFVANAKVTDEVNPSYYDKDYEHPFDLPLRSLADYIVKTKENYPSGLFVKYNAIQVDYSTLTVLLLKETNGTTTAGLLYKVTDTLRLKLSASADFKTIKIQDVTVLGYAITFSNDDDRDFIPNGTDKCPKEQGFSSGTGCFSKEEKAAFAVAEKARKQREKDEKAALAGKDKNAVAKAEKEKKEKEAAALAEKERKEKEALALAEKEKKENEAVALAEKERQEKEAVALAEKERKEKEAIALAEKEKKEKEAKGATTKPTSKDAIAKAEKEKKEKEAADLAEKERKAQAEKEAIAKAEKEKAENEAIAQAEKEKAEKDAAAKAEADRIQKEKDDALARQQEEDRKKQEHDNAFPGFFIGFSISGGNNNFSVPFSEANLGYNKMIKGSKSVLNNTGLALNKQAPFTQVQLDLDYFFGSKKKFGIATGLGFSSFNASFKMDSFRVNYSAVDTRGETYRRVVNVHAIDEDLKIKSLNIPIILQYKFGLGDKANLCLGLGVNYHSVLSANVSSTATADYEAIYNYANGSQVSQFDSSIVPSKGSWMITRSNIEAHGGKAGEAAYFTQKRADGYDVAIDQSLSKTEALSLGSSLGVILRLNANFQLSEKLWLSTLLQFQNVSFANNSYIKNYKLTDEIGTYNSLMNNTNLLKAGSVSLGVGLKITIK